MLGAEALGDWVEPNEATFVPLKVLVGYELPDDCQFDDES